LLVDEEKKIFNLDIEKIDWYIYLLHFAWGLQKFILKENVEAPSYSRRYEMKRSKNEVISDL